MIGREHSTARDLTKGVLGALGLLGALFAGGELGPMEWAEALRWLFGLAALVTVSALWLWVSRSLLAPLEQAAAK